MPRAPDGRPEREEPTATLRLRLPDSVHRRLSDLARRRGIPLEALARAMVLERLAALEPAQTPERTAPTAGRPPGANGARGPLAEVESVAAPVRRRRGS